MQRYIDADALYRYTEKRIAEAHEARMAVVDDEFLDLINDAHIEDDVMEVVRCKGCMFWRGKDHDGVCIENGLATRMENEFCSRGKKKGSESDGTTQT